MNRPTEYSAHERLWLWFACAVGFLGVNVAFVYGLTQPGTLAAALRNPIALAFMGEAFALMGLLAWLLTKWGMLRLRWPWFVGLSILGGLLFALPLALLWPSRKAD